MADPYTTPIPGASGYESATLAAKTAYQNAVTRLNQQRGDTLRQYGYSSAVDPTSGTVTATGIDAGLPQGLYQQERQQHADQYQQARDSAQERGIGHGGLAGHVLNRVRQGFGADDAALGSGLSSALSGFQDQQNQAKYQQDSALAEAQLQQTRDAIQAQMFNQANLDGLDVPEGPDWAAIIQGLLGGDNNGPPPPGAAAPAKNSPKSAAAMYTLLNKPAPAPTPKPAPTPAPKPKPAPAPAPAKKKKAVAN